MITRLSGALSARPAAVNASGVLYLATDLNVVYFSTGGVWVERRNDPAQAETAGESSGLLSARPVAGTRVGWLYFCSDEGIWYEAFPTAWYALKGGAAQESLALNTQTGDYTLTLADAGSYVRLTKGTAGTVTVPPNSEVPFVGAVQIVLRQAGAGQMTVTAGAGVTINSGPGLNLRAQHSAASLIRVGTDEWDLAGDLE